MTKLTITPVGYVEHPVTFNVVNPLHTVIELVTSIVNNINNNTVEAIQLKGADNSTLYLPKALFKDSIIKVKDE